MDDCRITFPKYPNFEIEDARWGIASIENVVAVLESVIENIEGYLLPEKSTPKKVIIKHSDSHNPPIDHPKFYKGQDSNNIYLATKDHYWAQYSYQFSHELCHHYFDCDYNPVNDGYGWLEETFAELASIFVLKKMAEKWEVSPPYDNWKDFSQALKSYYDGKINDFTNKTNEPFPKWFHKKINGLFLNRYSRSENGIIAVEIMTVFDLNPELWKIIQFYKDIENKNDLSWDDFLNSWLNKLPEDLKVVFPLFSNLFNQSVKDSGAAS